LVVDDDDSIRDVLAYLLHDAGYEVYEFPDGEPALQRLRESESRMSESRMVVLLDMNMPGMDGKALLRAVAEHDTLATQHAFILMTANEQPLHLTFVTLLLDLRVSILAKPFDIDHLLDVVRHTEQRLARAEVLLPEQPQDTAP
jgi:CheY-like chemotaxis protein